MKFTTHLELHSQTTRLFESVSHGNACRAKDGILTLSDAPFQGNLDSHGYTKTLLQTTIRREASLPDFKFELFPVHSPLLGESLLVSFPPLTDMLKFSG